MALAGEGPWQGRQPLLDIEAQRLFRLALDSSPSGVVVVDHEGRIALVNHQLERQFGYTSGELIGQSIDVLVPDAQRALHAAHGQDFMKDPQARSMGAGRELYGRRRDGSEFPVEIGLSPIRAGHGSFILASVVDITARREMEQANRLALEERLAFERLVADVSLQFINLPPDQVNDAIRHALRQIGETLDLDRCTFYRIEPDGMLVDPVSWERAGIPPVPAPVPAKERFPWAFETALAGELVCFSTIDEIPNPIDRASYRAFGTQSAVTVPL